MPDDSTQTVTDPTALVTSVLDVPRKLWRDLVSIYCANTPFWRWLKSGALVFLGFFLWMGGNVLLSVKPEWTVLHFVMAYGLVVLFWGPFTHFVVVPGIIRLRRNADGRVTRSLARNGSKLNFGLFLLVVVAVALATPGVMFLDFSSSLGGSGEADVAGELACDFGEETVTCHVEEPEGIDHVVATTGGETIATAEEPPYEFTVDRADLTETRTGKEFRVEYRGENGETLRRFVRTVPS